MRLTQSHMLFLRSLKMKFPTDIQSTAVKLTVERSV